MLITHNQITIRDDENNIKIGNVKIEKKQYVKFLGIVLDENLNWKKTHTNHTKIK